jgi:hypothetical protein
LQLLRENDGQTCGEPNNGTFSQASSQEKKHERGSESETVVENEALLGSEKSWQKVIEAAWRFGGLYGSTAFEATQYPKVQTHTAGIMSLDLAIFRSSCLPRSPH